MSLQLSSTTKICVYINKYDLHVIGVYLPLLPSYMKSKYKGIYSLGCGIYSIFNRSVTFRGLWLTPIEQSQLDPLGEYNAHAMQVCKQLSYLSYSQFSFPMYPHG